MNLCIWAPAFAGVVSDICPAISANLSYTDMLWHGDEMDRHPITPCHRSLFKAERVNFAHDRDLCDLSAGTPA